MKIHEHTFVLLRFMTVGICIFILGYMTVSIRQRLSSSFLQMSIQGKGKTIHAIAMHVSPHIAYRVLLAHIDSRDFGTMHDLIPVVGDSAFKRYGSGAYKFCDTTIDPLSCYYGVMLGAVQKFGYRVDIMNKIASECVSNSSANAQDRCFRGVGYTILFLNKFWYIESLQFCDGIFASTNQRNLCWVGVTHENVNRVGDILHGLFDAPWTIDNIYYPCDSIPLSYQSACVQEQMLAVRKKIFAGDTKKSIAYCDHFSQTLTQQICVNALIHTIAQEGNRNGNGMHEVCQALSSRNIEQCSTYVGD